MTGMEGRLVALEIKSTYQEAIIADLSAAYLEQEGRIDKLESLVRALRDKVKELSGEGQLPLPAGERPPHY